jgi:hypothetical protein
VDRLAAGSRGCRQLAGERERALVAVDVDHHPAGDQVFGLHEGPVGDWRSTLPVVPDERALGRERLAVDVLTGALEPGGEVGHELQVVLDTNLVGVLAGDPVGADQDVGC